MPKNRVEQLESSVEALESTVDGLTEELVEAKERIRVLEAELDAETPTRVPPRRNENGAIHDDTERTESTAADGRSTDSTTASEDLDSITSTEETATEDGSNHGEAQDSGTDDIIVA